jgi:two-component system, OmpR family, sensor histidine kinase KdpD
MEGRQQESRSKLWYSGLRSLGGVLFVGLVTFICYGLRVNLATVAFFYLLVIVLLSLAGDFRSTVFVSLVSSLALDYFFTPPVLSFAVSDPIDIVALASFLITGVVITHLTTGVREEAQRTEVHARAMGRLYELAQYLLALDPEKEEVKGFLETFRRVFDLQAVCLFISETAELYVTNSSHDLLTEKTRYAYIGGEDSDFLEIHISVRCLRTSAGTIGAVGFEGLDRAEKVAAPLASLVAIMLERRRAFERASQSAGAEKAELFRGAILDALAHEFKTPLATIMAATESVAGAGPLLPEQRELTDIVQIEASRLSSLTSRLLRTARLDREDVIPRVEIVDLTSIAANAIAQYSRHWTDHVFTFHDEGARKILADPELIRLAVSQLLENACKYSVGGSNIIVTLGIREDFTTARIWNRGSMIPQEERSRIFERFYRGTNSSRLSAGSGLGLYVARKIAVAHGGNLELDDKSTVSEGTSFCLSIPTAKENSIDDDGRMQRSGRG